MPVGRLEANGAMGLAGSDWNADDIAIPLDRVRVGVEMDSCKEVSCRAGDKGGLGGEVVVAVVAKGEKEKEERKKKGAKWEKEEE
jgi:hypothetical protein